MQFPRIPEDRVSTWAWAKRPDDKKFLDNAVGDMPKIAVHKPVYTKAARRFAASRSRGLPIAAW
jgi:hypothetical protein